jgi:hypothetical protein
MTLPHQKLEVGKVYINRGQEHIIVLQIKRDGKWHHSKVWFMVVPYCHVYSEQLSPLKEHQMAANFKILT